MMNPEMIRKEESTDLKTI